MTPYPTSLDIPQYMMDAMDFLKGNHDPAARNKLYHDSWEALGYAGGKYFPIDGDLKMALPFVPFHFDFTDKRSLISTLENHQRVMSSEAFDPDKLWSFLMALAQRIITLILNGQ